MEFLLACKNCLAGFECATKGLIEPTACPEGYYCPLYDANLHNPGDPIGQYPVDANGDPTYKIPCPAGTYSSRKYLTDKS